jgi:hypothetical protein
MLTSMLFKFFVLKEDVYNARIGNDILKLQGCPF